MGSGHDGVLGPYALDYAVHDMALCPSSAGDGAMWLATSSFLPEAPNFVEISSLDLGRGGVVQAPQPVARLPHYFPPSRVRWLPGMGSSAELLATSGDCLRIWRPDGQLHQLLRHGANPEEVCTPITSVDWSEKGGLASCDVYGVCVLWDVNSGTAVQAFDLGQQLCDVAYGGDHGLVAVAGERGDCFLLDPRQAQDVHVLSSREKARGPARLAWSACRTDLLAVSWQGEGGGVVLHSIHQPGHAGQKSTSRMLRTPGSGAVAADIEWSPAYPEQLCCAKEDGVVEVWQFPLDGDFVTAAASPSSRWEPARGEVCTALSLSHEVRPGQHFIALATMPETVASGAAGPSASLWLAGLPEPVRAPRRPLHPGSIDEVTQAAERTPLPRASAPPSSFGPADVGGRRSSADLGFHEASHDGPTFGPTPTFSTAWPRGHRGIMAAEAAPRSWFGNLH